MQKYVLLEYLNNLCSYLKVTYLIIFQSLGLPLIPRSSYKRDSSVYSDECTRLLIDY